MSAVDHSTLALKKKDKERQLRAKNRSTTEWKEQQKKKRRGQLGVEDKAEEKEGPSYEPGRFGPDGELMDLPTSVDSIALPARTCRTCAQPRKGHSRAKVAHLMMNRYSPSPPCLLCIFVL